MKTIFRVLYLFFLITATYPAFSVQAQTEQTNPAGTTQVQPGQSAQSTEPPLPELPPTPRSKLEIIQYILLPFAIGASIWLILHLEKMEREEPKENNKS